ncbi:hypothetical protein BP6252_06847 [Coleophoma cylindrospora]|uniref:Cytochrome P450 n=1 Tax=Coleophoma cylindrospora TaxID=1849047 RepID=A0A3D8RG55_9HELO|nr:hypothetical protein BP6252_06847 [Coleophoma cylindrospora]
MVTYPDLIPGPIVRITPFELHVEDSNYWDEFYSRSSRYDKYEWMAGRFGANTMTFTTASSELHALRRAPPNSMFSKRSIAMFEPTIQDKVEIMCKGIASSVRSPDGVLVLSDAFSAYVGDVITDYCFGFSYNHLESPGFRENFHAAFVTISGFEHLALHFPMMHPIMNGLPNSVVEAMNPDLHMILKVQKDLRVQIANIMNKESKVEPKHPTIFYELLKSNLPPQEKSINRLGDEAQMFIGAGLETTSWALTATSFQLLSNPEALAKLRAELEEAMPNPSKILDSRSLEKLPYLTACIQKAHAFHMEYPLEIRGSLQKNRCGTLLQLEEEQGHALASSNLAYAELYLALATVFRRFQFELYDTDVSDIELAHDFFLPTPKLDSKGVRVKVKSVASG